MMLPRSFFSLVLLGVLVTACSSDNWTQDSGAKYFVANLQSRLADGSSAPQTDPLIGLTQSRLAEFNKPTILAHLESSGGYSSATEIARNGQVQTFMTTDQISISMNHGVVVATRGIGADLLGATAEQTLAHLRSGNPEDYQRVYRHLDGENHTIRTTFACHMENHGIEKLVFAQRSYATRKMVERCLGPEEEFDNTYWVGTANFVIRKSRQRLSPVSGFVRVHLLVE